MGPLEGFVVLDFTTAVSGGGATQILADMGASVIKVEPLEGDFFRITNTKHGDSPRWMSVNRGKRSLCVNLKMDKGKEIVYKIAVKADVVMHNFRLGVAERLGLGYEDIARLNPKVIYMAQYAFGRNGPMARWGGGDMWAQAMGGVVSIQGSPSGQPYLGGVCWVDQGSAVISAMSMITALLVRERSGIGQEVTTNLLDVCMSLQTAQMGDYLIDHQKVFKRGRGWGGNFPYGPYTAGDGEIMIMHGSADEEWAQLCKILQIDDILSNPDYNTTEKRFERREQLYPVLDKAFSKKSRDEWQKLFFQNKLRADPCLSYEELFAHPQVEANDIVTSVKHPAEGNLKMIGCPIKFSKTPAGIRRPPPLLGEHSGEILRELGYTTEEISSFAAEGIIGPAAVS